MTRNGWIAVLAVVLALVIGGGAYGIVTATESAHHAEHRANQAEHSAHEAENEAEESKKEAEEAKEKAEEHEGGGH
jgi:uncharacterized protein HemX